MSSDYTSSTVHFPKTNLYPYERKWNVNDIWEITKNFESKLISVDKLWNDRYAKAWCWQHENELINNEFFLHHMERVINADLSYPIILSEENLIFDGVHRLVKAKFYNLEKISYVKFKKDPLPKNFN